MATADNSEHGGRLVSLDAYRGFVMLAMASGGLALAKVAKTHVDSPVWQALGGQTEHVAWQGCSFWDLIQPSFIFIVGAAMPFSFANRRGAGETQARLFGHVLRRSAVLVLLAIFLSSASSKQTHFIFTNVLAQIGLGYPFVYLLLGRSPRTQLTAAFAILVGYWLWFAAGPPPSPGELVAWAGRDPAMSRLGGFAAHWSKHANPASAFDRVFLPLFPGNADGFNVGGYATLNFIPSMATMIFGVVAGGFLRSDRTPAAKVKGLFAAGAAGLLLGAALGETVCPVVKRIWTPSWAVYSAGWTVLLLAVFYAVVDVVGFRRWAFPLVVVGANSIAMYVMAQLLKPFAARTLRTHLGGDLFAGEYGPVVESASVLAVFWLACFWMYRRKIFVRV